MLSGEDKSEAATPKRRGEARKKGQVPKSMELSHIFVMLGLLMAINGLGSAMSQICRTYFQSVYEHLGNTPLTTSEVMGVGRTAALTLLRSIAPLVTLEITLAVVINFMQTGPLFAFEKLKPDFKRINPLSGMKRFVSANGAVELVKSIFKITIIAYLAYSTIQGGYPRLLLLSRMDVMTGVGFITDLIYRMTTRITMAMLVMSVIDYAYQRYSYEKSLKMSKHEVKEEGKQAEGNPQIKSRIRSKQREIARKRMMASVPLADVVVTNPTHFAVALKYDPEEMSAPIVIAKGQDLIALKIRDIARESDVPIVENPPLARTLYKYGHLGKEIPGDVYEAVAEVLAYVYQINRRRYERSMGGVIPPVAASARSSS